MKKWLRILLRRVRGERLYVLRPGECLRNPRHGLPAGTILRADGKPYLLPRDDG